MTFQKICTVFIGIGLLFFSSALQAENLYIKSYKVKPMESLTSKKSMAPITRGTKVEKLFLEQQWVKIDYNGKSGWVHKLSVSSRPPVKRVSLLAKNIDISTVARKRASSFTSTGAARGLSDVSKIKLADRIAPNFELLQEIENVVVDPEQAVAFLMEDE